MSGFKAIQFPVEAISGKSDAERDLYCLSKREVAILLSMTEYVGWRTRWDGDISSLDIDLIRSNLERSLQKPMSCGDYDNQQTVTNQMMQNFIRLQSWDGTNNNTINPSAPTTNFNYTGSDNENTSLCAAITEYVNQSILMVHNALAYPLGIASVSAGVLGWLGGALGAVVGGVLVLGVGVVYGSVANAVNDRTSMDTIICQLFDTMKALPANKTNFQTSINGLSSSNDNEATIVLILKLACGNDANYAWFIDLIANAKSMVESITLTCGCDNVVRRLSGYGNDNMTSVALAGGTAFYIPSIDVYQAQYVSLAVFGDVRLNKTVNNVTKIKVWYGIHRTRGVGYNGVIMNVNGVDVVNTPIVTTAESQEVIQEYTTPVPVLTTLRLYHGVETQALNYGDVRINKIEVWYS